ncbi:MAG: electron transport complex subunit E [Xanthomonadales bacterium]|nr:electron transport complex subunit E [Xanthomonadales bacterium]
MTDAVQIWRDGLWRNNAGLVQLLGLCPLLAVSNQVSYALGLGLATVVVLCLSNLIVSLLRPLVKREIRIAVYVVVIATAVTCVELLIHAYVYPLYTALGIFLPLIVTNCAIMGRAEAFASRNGPLASIQDGLATGRGFAAVLVVLGGLRELIGNGTLFTGMDALFGDWAAALELRFSEDGGFRLAMRPPGAFLALGLLVALHRWISNRKAPEPRLQGAEDAA